MGAASDAMIKELDSQETYGLCVMCQLDDVIEPGDAYCPGCRHTMDKDD